MRSQVSILQFVLARNARPGRAKRWGQTRYDTAHRGLAQRAVTSMIVHVRRSSRSGGRLQEFVKFRNGGLDGLRRRFFLVERLQVLGVTRDCLAQGSS